MNLSMTTKAFAEASPSLYEAMNRYKDHCLAERGVKGKQFSTTHSKEDMERAINKEFASEISKRTGLTVDKFDGSVKRYAETTSVKEMANAIRDFMIDMILPEVLMTGTVRYIADFRFADLLDSMSYDIENNALFTVSKAGYRKRSTNLQKLYKTNVTLTPENHMLTVGTDLVEVLTGRASIAKDVMKAALSIEASILYDAYDAFTTSANALTGNLAVANYSEESLIKLCETVTAFNNGKKAVIFGTPVALKKVLPSNANYRYLLSDDYVKLGALKDFNGYDVVPMSQVPDFTKNDYSLKLDDTKIYVVSPASNKIVQVGVFGESTTHTDTIYDNANLLQLSTISKAWDVQVITNSVAGVVKALA